MFSWTVYIQPMLFSFIHVDLSQTLDYRCLLIFVPINFLKSQNHMSKTIIITISIYFNSHEFLIALLKCHLFSCFNQVQLKAQIHFRFTFLYNQVYKAENHCISVYYNLSVPHFTAPACEPCSRAAGAPREHHFPSCVYLPCPQSFRYGSRSFKPSHFSYLQSYSQCKLYAQGTAALGTFFS